MKTDSTKDFIEKKLFDELVHTAAIDLNPSEMSSLWKELNAQMKIIRQLEAIPLDETISPVILGNPYPPEIRADLREDEISPFRDPEAIIWQAPVVSDGYIVSPDVPHQRIG